MSPENPGQLQPRHRRRRVNPPAVRYYPEPWPLARKICDHVAFWNGVTVEEVPDRP